MSYKIIRIFLNHPSVVIKRGQTLEEVQKHCSDKETSSSTCTKPNLIKLTESMGPWFDGYDKE